MAVEKPWKLGRRDLTKGRKSVYYQKWMLVINNLGSPTRSNGYKTLLAMHEADDAVFAYGTRAKAKAALRALKAAVIDGTTPDVYGSGCLINRWVQPPVWDSPKP